MPNKEFLESYPLYRKFRLFQDLPHKTPQERLSKGFVELSLARFKWIPKPAIHMDCATCKCPHTFNLTNEYWENYGNDTENPVGCVCRVVYQCTSCKQFQRFFLLKFGIDHDKRFFVEKVGQEPPWDISLDKNLEKTLGDHSGLYKKGLINESQGYGIGAFSYYRRIVEEIIDQLLNDIASLISDKDREHYMEALEATKRTKIAQDKIELVKEHLPPILRPGGMNPLSALHEVLSEGLHAKSDEECIELAMRIRTVLVFLVNQVIASRDASQRFTESMRSILARQSEKK